MSRCTGGRRRPSLWSAWYVRAAHVLRPGHSRFQGPLSWGPALTPAGRTAEPESPLAPLTDCLLSLRAGTPISEMSRRCLGDVSEMSQIATPASRSSTHLPHTGNMPPASHTTHSLFATKDRWTGDPLFGQVNTLLTFSIGGGRDVTRAFLTEADTDQMPDEGSHHHVTTDSHVACKSRLQGHLSFRPLERDD